MRAELGTKNWDDQGFHTLGQMTALILLHMASNFASLNSGKCLNFLWKAENMGNIAVWRLFFRIKLWHKCYHKTRLWLEKLQWQLSERQNGCEALWFSVIRPLFTFLTQYLFGMNGIRIKHARKTTSTCEISNFKEAFSLRLSWISFIKHSHLVFILEKER